MIRLCANSGCTLHLVRPQGATALLRAFGYTQNNLNRGDNSIVRITQAGSVVAVRQIVAEGVPGFRVNGLAVSEDARAIWVTATTPDHKGVVLQVPTFGAGPVTTSLITHAIGVKSAGAYRPWLAGSAAANESSVG